MLPVSRIALIAAGLAAPAVALAAPAATPAAAPAPTTDQSLGGPVVPGVCVLSREAVFAAAKVGQAASARLKTLTDQAQAEVNSDRGPLEQEAKALESQKASLTAAQLKAKQDTLAPRWAALQQKAELRSREIEATRAKALARIALEAQPVVTQVYRSRNCGMLLTRDAMLGGNPAADLTAAVVQGLDGKMTTITFDRETLPAAGAVATTKP